jgi:Uma2 family endonuclease
MHRHPGFYFPAEKHLGDNAAMASLPQHIPMSEDAYFEMLEKSIHKYEYWNGVAVAMAGAQPEHVRIETNIVGELFQQLRGENCVPLGSNQAVKLAASRGCVFPDVTVVCGKPEYIVKRGIGCLLNPSLVVEVLSPSTAAMDETDKLLAYTAIRTIREYLVVSSDRMAVKLFFRGTADETWGVRPYALPTDSLTFESCGCTLTLAEIYAGLDLPSRQLF